VLLGSSDEQLVDLVLDGDHEAFEVLFHRHVADAVWFARDVLGSWAEAEEAVRHSFAAAHAYLASRDREIEFAPWLHTILSNHCLSMLQARGPRAIADDVSRFARRRPAMFLAAASVAGFAIGRLVRSGAMQGSESSASEHTRYGDFGNTLPPPDEFDRPSTIAGQGTTLGTSTGALTGDTVRVTTP
jgi:hypothetical protein